MFIICEGINSLVFVSGIIVIIVITGHDGTVASTASRFYSTSLTLPMSPLLSLYRYICTQAVSALRKHHSFYLTQLFINLIPILPFETSDFKKRQSESADDKQFGVFKYSSEPANLSPKEKLKPCLVSSPPLALVLSEDSKVWHRTREDDMELRLRPGPAITSAWWTSRGRRRRSSRRAACSTAAWSDCLWRAVWRGRWWRPAGRPSSQSPSPGVWGRDRRSSSQVTTQNTHITQFMLSFLSQLHTLLFYQILLDLFQKTKFAF